MRLSSQVVSPRTASSRGVGIRVNRAEGIGTTAAPPPIALSGFDAAEKRPSLPRPKCKVNLSRLLGALQALRHVLSRTTKRRPRERCPSVTPKGDASGAREAPERAHQSGARRRPSCVRAARERRRASSAAGAHERHMRAAGGERLERASANARAAVVGSLAPKTALKARSRPKIGAGGAGLCRRHGRSRAP